MYCLKSMEELCVFCVYECDFNAGTWFISRECATYCDLIYPQECSYIFGIIATYTPANWHALISVIQSSGSFRALLLKRFCSSMHRKYIYIKVDLTSSMSEFAIIDYAWNKRLLHLVGKRFILDSVMAYLSTLGGAFSSLGDMFPNFAETAGNISKAQFQIALHLGDKPLIARCRLFLALSLLQQGQFTVAKEIIVQQHLVAHELKDTKLRNMCKGVWAKLKYAKKHLKAIESVNTV